MNAKWCLIILLLIACGSSFNIMATGSDDAREWFDTQIEHERTAKLAEEERYIAESMDLHASLCAAGLVTDNCP